MQGELQRALGVVLRRDPPRLVVAGRTDRGVHALAQVVSYEGPRADPRGLNALLPDDVAVLSCEVAPHGFSARHDATSRAYCYRVLHRPARAALQCGRALWWPHALDLPALRECAATLVGRHDFTAFTPSQTQHMHFERRVLSAEWRERGELLELWVEADSFLRRMNRVLVGTMLEVGGARRSVADFPALLTGVPRSRAGRTAPPHGLYLAGVGYGGRPVLASAAPLSVLAGGARGGRSI